MTTSRLIALACAAFPRLLAADGEQPPPPPELDAMLARIADHQESAQAGRARIVYTQYIHARLIRANGKLAREEKRTYTVTPKEKGSERMLEKFEGWYESKGKMLPYDAPGFTYKGVDIDGDLIDDMINDWTGDGGSRDGIDKDQFPLTREGQQKYDFRYEGLAPHGAARVHHLSFLPRDKWSWKGDVFVDPADLHPVSVSTSWAGRIPRAVRMMLGTNVRQVGFAVSYARTIDGLWFPVSYGTEMSWRVLFGYARTLTLSMTNSDFRRASADTHITFDQISQAERDTPEKEKP